MYSCSKCMKSFSSWTNFKRHGIEVHQLNGRFKCKRCDFKTNRNETLMRHAQSKHKGYWIVKNILNEVIGDAVQNIKKARLDMAVDLVGELLEDAVNVSKAHGDGARGFPVYESEYLRCRNAYVAEVQAEFRRLYPSFNEEVQSLRPKKKPRKTSSSVWPQEAVRKSSRITKNSMPDVLPISCNGDKGSDDNGINSDAIEEEVEPQEEAAASYGDNEDSSVNISLLGKFACLPCKSSFRLVF